MFKFECTYKNYYGEERTETVYFQLSRPEVMEFAVALPGGLEAGAQRLVESHDHAEMFDKFQKLIAKAYGEISQDGRRFIKSPEMSKAFMETPIYEKMFDKMISDPNFVNEFCVGCVPEDAKGDVASSLADFLRSTDTPAIEATTTGATN